MKDIQGIQRGKCNSDGCDCDEYRTTPPGESSGTGSGRLRCEYCDHAPVHHVKIIELGECKGCGKDNCEKYESEDPNSYTNCAYCDCPANQHVGAEKLRKPQPQQTAAVAAAMGGSVAPMMMGGAQMSGGFQPRMDMYGQPTQSLQFGTCKCPGCPYPKRVEGDRVYDFCSRTCSKKYSQSPLQMQGGAPSQYMSGAMYGKQVVGGAPGPGMSGGGVATTGGAGRGGGGGQLQGHSYASTASYGQPSSAGGPGYGQTTGVSSQPPTAAGGLQPAGPANVLGGSSGGGGGSGMCTKCGVQPANPGRGWCQGCYSKS